jgi:hypothetical protein
MTLQITDKEALAIRRLGNALNSEVINFGDLRSLISTLQCKIDSPQGSRKRTCGIKAARKDRYRTKLKVA